MASLKFENHEPKEKSKLVNIIIKSFHSIYEVLIIIPWLKKLMKSIYKKLNPDKK